MIKFANKIKGFFPLSIGRIFSNLSLPHISVSAGSPPFGIGGKGSLPSFSVSWYRKAEDNPYLLSRATLFGAGEGKDELVYGRAALMRDIREASGGGREVVNNNTFYIYGASDPEETADVVLRKITVGLRTA